MVHHTRLMKQSKMKACLSHFPCGCDMVSNTHTLKKRKIYLDLCFQSMIRRLKGRNGKLERRQQLTSGWAGSREKGGRREGDPPVGVASWCLSSSDHILPPNHTQLQYFLQTTSKCTVSEQVSTWQGILVKTVTKTILIVQVRPMETTQ